MERKQTMLSTVSQTPSITAKNIINGLKRQETKSLNSPLKHAEFVNNLMVKPKTSSYVSIRSMKEVSRVNINSPRFERARVQLKIPVEDCQIK